MLEIDGRMVGAGHDVFLIAEVGQAHDGSLGAAHAYIDAASQTGVDAIKFQTHIAQEESTSAENFRVRVFPQDTTRFDYWKRTGFEKHQWIELASHARDKGLVFLSSPFSNLAVDWLIECGTPAWKVASGELTNRPMLAKMCATGKPLLISSGMSSWKELQETIEFVESRQAGYGVFQCTTAYPCPPEQWGLNVVAEFIAKFGCPVGLSDHSGSIVPSIAAVAFGASMLEFHIAFSKSQFGPDAKASLTLEQTSDLVRAVRQLSIALRSPIDKDAQAIAMTPLHELFTKSIVAARDLEAGHILCDEDLAFKKPGNGWSARDKDAILGKILQIKVPKDHFFRPEDF